MPEANLNGGPGYWERLERKTRRQHWQKLINAPEALKMHRGGLTQQEIARRMGVSQPTVSRMIRYQRQREVIESKAPPGSVEWAHTLACPGCGTLGMLVRCVKRGTRFWTMYGDWIAGCVFYSFREFDGGCNGIVPLTGRFKW